MKKICVIEISEQYVKVFSPQTSSCAVERIAGLSETEIAARVKEMLKSQKVRGREAALCLPRHVVTSRTVHLPSQDAREIAQMVGLHLTRIVPYPKEDIRCVFKVVGTDELQYSRVLLTIAHKDMVQKPIAILEKSGLLVERVVVSTGGVWQAAVRAGAGRIKKQELYAAVDIDAAAADFIIFNTEFVFFTRSIAFAAQDLVSAESVTKFIGELKQSLLIFNSEESPLKPQHVFVSGAADDGLVRMIGTELAIPAVKLPVAGRGGGPESAGGVSLSGVCELAVEERDPIFSFSLPELEIRKTLKQRMKESIVLGSLLIYLLTVGLLFVFTRSQSRQAYVRQLQGYARQIELEMGEALAHLDQLVLVKKFLLQRAMPLYVFSRVQDVVGGDVALELLSMEKGKLVTLRGHSRTLSEIFGLVSRLEAIPGVENVQTRYTRKKILADKSEAVDFGITFTVRAEPDAPPGEGAGG
ncbi:MAG: pilus assembly protein PilM [Candidatus Omnitrophica bacterium]|nr:pilus assembly protein PilM [Candidatus Omnitrophota bacterium]